MAFKLMETAQKKWQRLKNHRNLAKVQTGVKFVNGTKKMSIKYNAPLETRIEQI